MQTRRYTNHAATVASSAAVPLAGEEAEHDGVDHLSEAQLVAQLMSVDTRRHSIRISTPSSSTPSSTPSSTQGPVSPSVIGLDGERISWDSVPDLEGRVSFGDGFPFDPTEELPPLYSPSPLQEQQQQQQNTTTPSRQCASPINDIDNNIITINDSTAISCCAQDDAVVATGERGLKTGHKAPASVSSPQSIQQHQRRVDRRSPPSCAAMATPTSNIIKATLGGSTNWVFRGRDLLESLDTAAYNNDPFRFTPRQQQQPQQVVQTTPLSLRPPQHEKEQEKEQEKETDGGINGGLAEILMEVQCLEKAKRAETEAAFDRARAEALQNHAVVVAAYENLVAVQRDQIAKLVTESAVVRARNIELENMLRGSQRPKTPKMVPEPSSARTSRQQPFIAGSISSHRASPAGEGRPSPYAPAVGSARSSLSPQQVALGCAHNKSAAVLASPAKSSAGQVDPPTKVSVDSASAPEPAVTSNAATDGDVSETVPLRVAVGRENVRESVVGQSGVTRKGEATKARVGGLSARTTASAKPGPAAVPVAHKRIVTDSASARRSGSRINSATGGGMSGRLRSRAAQESAVEATIIRGNGQMIISSSDAAKPSNVSSRASKVASKRRWK